MFKIPNYLLTDVVTLELIDSKNADGYGLKTYQEAKTIKRTRLDLSRTRTGSNNSREDDESGKLYIYTKSQPKGFRLEKTSIGGRITAADGSRYEIKSFAAFNGTQSKPWSYELGLKAYD